MATLRWQGAGNVDKLAKQIRAERDRIESEMRAAVAQRTIDGADLVRENLLAATTRTGRAREEFFGGLPGRYESGAMYQGVQDNSAQLREDGRTARGLFGWFAGMYQKYFREQDLGTAKIPAANALSDAFVFVREALRRDFDAIVRGRKPE